MMFLRRFRILFVTIKIPSRRATHLHRFCSRAAFPLRDKKPKSSISRNTAFVDWRCVKVFGGVGGDGCISFMKLFCNPDAGPDGGDGGNGGHVIFEASDKVKSLENVESIISGEGGLSGLGKDMHGRCGEHTVVQVPVGTVIKSNKNEFRADLDRPGMRFLAARGGAGGKGNAFYLSNENRHPRVCEKGAIGEEISYILEMKTMAHAGMVGFPNAGKSTLLRAISRARPKVAAYPFTTLRPHVGIVHYDDFEQIAVADLPGLIEDAHKNRGLGIAFLRHVERCVCLLFVLDLSSSSAPHQLEVLINELEHYKKGFTIGPHAVIANKIDVPGAEENLKTLEKCTDLPIIPISAKFGNNVSTLLQHIRRTYDDYSKEKLAW